MKVITDRYVETLIASIVHESQEQAEKAKIQFDGISGETLLQEMERRLGDKFKVKKDDGFRMNKSDVSAIASSRFFKKKGQQILMGAAIVILALATAVKWIPNMNAVDYNIAYTLCGVIALVFVIVYSRMQSKVRKEVWRQLGRNEDNEE